MDVTLRRDWDQLPAAGETSTADPTYVLSRWLFIRLLGLVYLIAFVSLALQVTGLVGEHGILPATAFLDRTRALYGGGAYRLFPTICWLGAGDGALRLLCWSGAALALLVVAGVAQAPALAHLWSCYLSLSVVGQTFLWFQWDGLLLETGLLAVLYAPTRWLPSRQLGIALTGNYGFFNVLAIVLCVALLDDAALRRVLPLRLAAGEPEPLWWRRVTGTLAVVIAPLSALTVAREIGATLPGGRGSGDSPMLRVVAPLRSINGYGLFRVMTTERPEIVIEGSRDSVDWREYEFRWKPGGVTRRPGFVAPHQPRLDWQMWFAALDPAGAEGWLAGLVRGLLKGTPQVVSLLDANPFPDAPPRYVRLVSYRYRFTTREERAQSGAWWAREFTGFLTRPITLSGTPPPPDSAAPRPPGSLPPRRRRP